MSIEAIATLVALTVVALWLFIGIDACDRWWTRRQKARALAALAVAAPTRIVTEGADDYRGLAHETARPIFNVSGVRRRDWGDN